MSTEIFVKNFKNFPRRYRRKQHQMFFIETLCLYDNNYSTTYCSLSCYCIFVQQWQKP